MQLNKMEPWDLKVHNTKNYISFFSGALGLDIGLERAGFTPLLYNEYDKDAQLTIKYNRPNTPVIKESIMDIELRDILAITKNKKIDLVVGGPPCQSFSTVGKRLSTNDPRGNTLLRFLEIATSLSPECILIENVRGLISASTDSDKRPGVVLGFILGFLKNEGYQVSFSLYDTSLYGVPQKRERLIIKACKGQRVPILTPTTPKRDKTLKMALEGLDKDCKGTKFSKSKIKYYKLLGPGENWRDLPVNLQKEALGNSYYSGGGKTGFLRRLAWDKPSPTLLTSPTMTATALAHPEEDRPLNINEYKRIQTFPDNFEIQGSIGSQYRQIGNAVPCDFAYLLGKHLMSVMDGDVPCEYIGDTSRYKNCNDLKWKEPNQKYKKIKKAA